MTIATFSNEHSDGYRLEVDDEEDEGQESEEEILRLNIIYFVDKRQSYV